LTLLLLAGSSGLAVGCAGQERNSPPPQQMTSGSPERGAALIDRYGCGSCHTIPGIDGADSLVGPPLDHFARRSYVAGVLPNKAENLEHWIEDPHQVVPGNAMPDLGVSHREAIDITAYLYTLR
jgi:cytochrome c2